MGKSTGFLEFPRSDGAHRPPSERTKDYREFSVPLSHDELAVQACRCMECGIPYCHAMGCPLHNLIPEWNDCVCRGDWKEALARLEMTNNLPEITGRVCPAPCEAACTLAINCAPVTIKQLELAIAENGYARGWIAPRPPRAESGKKAAVIGSGPAGLAAAQQLRRAGHRVTVFERSAKAGGILRYGIPDFKLEKRIIDRRVKQMVDEGVIFETNVTAGEDISVRYLRRTFDAVLLTTGAGRPRDLQVPGRGLENIHFAMEYLTRSNRAVSGEAVAEKIISARDRTVLVIGGGDTGSDCVGTAVRQGAKKVYQFEILPRPPAWEETTNPDWPYWPDILRRSSSHEEGCEREWSVITKGFRGRDVKLTEGHFARVEWNTDKQGRRKMTEVPGSEFSLKIDLVLLAMGFLHVEHNRLTDELGVAFDEKGNIKCNSDFRTSVDGVFAAGDAASGASLVVRAIHNGREAARTIDNYLKE
jgi:glutamate synthase (NADPH/NADH) small chain